MKHELPDLPYPLDALEPHMSRETLEYHHGKHHKGYVDKLNTLIRGTELEGLSLEELIGRSKGAVFNNAAQAWNHAFFWRCLAPEGGSLPSGDLRAAIERDCGSFNGFVERFRKAGTEVFGSGWVWLSSSGPDGGLSVETTANADNPLRSGRLPLITCDLWEHAYYIDYRNERARFLEGFFRLANWEFAAANYARGRAAAA